MGGYYHLSVSVISRSTGRSAVACAAYRAGQMLRDQRYGRTHDYERRRGIYETGIVAPPNAPTWVFDRERLWNSVEAAEKRKDAQLAREFVLAFPHQLDRSQRIDLLQEFIRTEVTSLGLVADWAIHAPNRMGDERNWHAHVMVSMRAISPDGFATIKDRSLNTPDQLVRWRAAWAEIQNHAYAQHQIRDEQGRVVRVDHRSFSDRGIDREPTVHLGPQAVAIERSGRASDRGDINREVKKTNEHRALVRRRASELTREEFTILAANDNRHYRPKRYYPESPDRKRTYGHDRDP